MATKYKYEYPLIFNIHYQTSLPMQVINHRKNEIHPTYSPHTILHRAHCANRANRANARATIPQ